MSHVIRHALRVPQKLYCPVITETMDLSLSIAFREVRVIASLMIPKHYLRHSEAYGVMRRCLLLLVAEF